VAKQPLKLKVRLPKYRYPRNAWWRDIRKAVAARMIETKIRYTDKDKLEIYLRRGQVYICQLSVLTIALARCWHKRCNAFS